MVATPHAGSGSQVATSRNVEASLRHETKNRLAVEHFSTNVFDELSAPSFAARTVCVQMRSLAAVSMWTNGKPTLDDGPLEKGCWQVHAPGHSFRALAPTGYDLVRFTVPESALGSTLNDLSLNRHPSALEFVDPGSVANPFLLNVAAEIRSALSGRPEGSRLYVDSLSAAVVSHLILCHSNIDHPERLAMEPRRGGLAPRHLKALTNYLEDHLADDVSLAELAAVCGLSTFHMSRAFRLSTGRPPHRWQLWRRVERAKELLERTSHPVIEIAAMVGYDNPSQFASVFRKMVGTSPTSFRRQR